MGERILVVEDEAGVLRVIIRILGKNGYVVFGVANAKEAQDIFKREKGNFDLVFSDITLPDKNGIELVDELISLNPDIHILISSGYTDDKSQLQTMREKGFKFIQKPYSSSDLLKVIRKAIEKT